MRWWLVYAGTRVTLVRSRSAGEAKSIAGPLFDRGRVRRSLPHGRCQMGRAGMAWLAFNDAARLLAEDGEACIPVRRTRPDA